MCLLIAEIIMLMGGMYALIAGKVELTKGISLEGWRARVVGIFLVAPLPVSFLAGFAIGALVELHAFPQSILNYVGVLEFVIVLAGLIGAAVFGALVKPKPAPEPESEEPLI
jgi:hypothetical protein